MRNSSGAIALLSRMPRNGGLVPAFAARVPIRGFGSRLGRQCGLRHEGRRFAPNARLAEFGVLLHRPSSSELRWLHWRKREGTARVPMLFAKEYARKDTGRDERSGRA